MWNGYSRLKWLLFWYGAWAWQAQVELHFVATVPASFSVQTSPYCKCMIREQSTALRDDKLVLHLYYRKMTYCKSCQKKSLFWSHCRKFGVKFSICEFSFHLVVDAILLSKNWAISVSGRYISFWDITDTAKDQIDEMLVHNPAGLGLSVHLVHFLLSPFSSLIYFYEGVFVFNIAIAHSNKWVISAQSVAKVDTAWTSIRQNWIFFH